MQIYEEDVCNPEDLKDFIEEERLRLKFRAVVLGLLNNFLLLAKDVKDEERCKYRLEHIETLVPILAECAQTSYISCGGTTVSETIYERIFQVQEVVYCCVRHKLTLFLYDLCCRKNWTVRGKGLWQSMKLVEQ
jgi:hypothetical protein